MDAADLAEGETGSLGRITGRSGWETGRRTDDLPAHARRDDSDQSLRSSKSGSPGWSGFAIEARKASGKATFQGDPSPAPPSGRPGLMGCRVRTAEARPTTMVKRHSLGIEFVWTRADTRRQVAASARYVSHGRIVPTHDGAPVYPEDSQACHETRIPICPTAGHSIRVSWQGTARTGVSPASPIFPPCGLNRNRRSGPGRYVSHGRILANSLITLGLRIRMATG